MTDTKITLAESDIPTHFYNIIPDLPTPLPPPLHPGTRQPIGPEALAPIFPMGLIAQEVSQQPMIEIPDEVRDIYRLYRPSPMYRARAFEEVLDTPAHIYYKSEHVSPVGSHKLNTALVQAYVNRQRDYDFGDTAETTPLLMMHTLGHRFVPPPVHAGGLRYHGSAPLVSHLLAAGVIEAEAYHQGEVFESAVKFAQCEGTIPAPESAHAIHSVVRHALEARTKGTPTVILFNLSGTACSICPPTTRTWAAG